MADIKIEFTKAHNPYHTIDPMQLDDHQIERLDNELEGEESAEYAQSLAKSHQNIKCVYTPLGLLPINEYTDMYSIFDLYTGNTNFDITKGVGKVIAKTEGVEIFHCFTRYRFLIGIGKAFIEERGQGTLKVREKICERVRQYIDGNTRLSHRCDE
jgi:hypothetical protein